MPNIKSAKKRVQLAKLYNGRNRMVKANVKSIIKKYNSALENGNVDEAKEMYPKVIKTIDQATAKGVYHKKTASNKKSKLTLRLNSASN